MIRCYLRRGNVSWILKICISKSNGKMHIGVCHDVINDSEILNWSTDVRSFCDGDAENSCRWTACRSWDICRRDRRAIPSVYSNLKNMKHVSYECEVITRIRINQSQPDAWQNTLVQRGHLWRHTFRWPDECFITMCIWRVCLWVKPFLQMWQLNGFTPVKYTKKWSTLLNLSNIL